MSGQRFTLDIVRPDGQTFHGRGSTLWAACLDVLPRLERAGVALPWTCWFVFRGGDGVEVGPVPLRLSEVVALALAKEKAGP